MAKKAFFCFVTFAILALVPGCVGCKAPVVPPRGWLYTNYQAPLEVNFHGSDFGSKTGSSKTQYLFVPWPIAVDIAWGDAAIRKAASDAHITTVKGADYEFMQIMGLYAEFTVHAYGD